MSPVCARRVPAGTGRPPPPPENRRCRSWPSPQPRRRRSRPRDARPGTCPPTRRSSGSPRPPASCSRCWPSRWPAGSPRRSKAVEIEAAFGVRLVCPVDEYNSARHVSSDSPAQRSRRRLPSGPRSSSAFCWPGSARPASTRPPPAIMHCSAPSITPGSVARRKHRAPGETRTVPIHPELVTLLRDHLKRYGTAPGGRIFIGPRAESLQTARTSRSSTRPARRHSPARRQHHCWPGALTTCGTPQSPPGSTPA